MKNLHIFKPGTQTDMRGQVIEFSESDLAASAAAYDPALHEAPLVVGHPAANLPAYGWVKSLQASAEGLQAEPQQVDSAFAELVEAGRFKKISASFYQPDSPNNPVPGVYYLRHVGFLGAQPPAVKGLKAIEFSASDEGVVEFSDWADRTNAGMWRRMRDWLIGKFGLEEADQIIPDYAIGILEDEARSEPDTSPSFEEPSRSHKENAVTPEEKARLEAENAQLKSRLADLDKKARQDAATHRHNESLAYAETLISAGTLLPKDKDLVVAMLDATGEQAIEFGEGSAKQPIDQAFKAFLATLPKSVEFSEFATNGNAGERSFSTEFAEKSTDPERLDLHQRASSLSAEKGIDYETAVRQLITQ